MVCPSFHDPTDEVGHNQQGYFRIFCRPELAMKRVIIVPITETQQFPGMEILARGGSIAALVGDTLEKRTRSAFDSEDSFFYSVGYGQADLYTFNTLDEAARFAKGKIEVLTAIERSIDTTRQTRLNP
jgi:hypothetical protein